MALNMTTAVFGENCNTATASPSLAQWDTEQVLQISGIDLPDSYKVEFSTVYTRNAIPKIGDASGVAIPNELLQRSAPITAYIVLYGEDGGRNREYWITIYITPGQPPETITPDPEQADVIDEAIAALNNGVARTEAAATSAEGSARDAEAAAEAVQNLSVAAETLATGEPATVEKAVDPETGAVTLNFGLPRGVKGDPLTYEDLTPEQKAELVQGPILEAQDAAVTAVGNARMSAVDAVGSAGTTQVNAVNQAGTTQTGAVNQAGANQVAAVNQAGATQVQAVEDKGNEVLDSIPPDYTDLVDDVAGLSRQISDETTGLNAKAPVIIDTASGAIASFEDGADGMPIKMLTVSIEPVQAGSSDPSPENVRHISGWTGCNVTRAGKNLAFKRIENSIIDSSGVIISITNSELWIARIIKDETYVIGTNGVDNQVAYAFYENNPVFGSISYNNSRIVTQNNYVFIAPINGYVAYRIYPSNGVYGQVELGTTLGAYEPYSGATIPITFPTPDPGTVYGGTLDVVDGLLTVTKGYVDLGTLNWNRDTTTRPADGATIHAFYTIVNDCKITTGIPNMLSSVFKADTIRDVDYGGNTNIKDFICSGADGNHHIWVYGSIYNDMSSAEFKTAMSGVQLVYDLSNPITYQLTPLEVTTLLGTNNIWADTGDVTVTAPRDTKLYIEKLTQPTEDDMTADHAISAGTFFMIGNTLYLATSQIATGGTITPGTNATQLSLADALNQLNT